MSTLWILWTATQAAAPGTTPEDDDSDTTYTARTTVLDGATIRPARLWLKHAADSGRNADLSAAERLPADRYRVRGLRLGRGRTFARRHRIVLECARAGEAFSLDTLVFSVEAVRSDVRPYTASTTSQTSRLDGATLAVPTLYLYHAADSLRNADLAVSGSDQDRHRVRFFSGAATRTGLKHRVAIQDDGRAGNCWGLDSLSFGCEKVSDGAAGLKAAAT